MAIDARPFGGGAPRSCGCSQPKLGPPCRRDAAQGDGRMDGRDGGQQSGDGAEAKQGRGRGDAEELGVQGGIHGGAALSRGARAAGGERRREAMATRGRRKGEVEAHRRGRRRSRRGPPLAARGRRGRGDRPMGVRGWQQRGTRRGRWQREGGDRESSRGRGSRASGARVRSVGRRLGLRGRRLGLGGPRGPGCWAPSLYLLFSKTENTKEEKKRKGSVWDSIYAWG